MKIGLSLLKKYSSWLNSRTTADKCLNPYNVSVLFKIIIKVILVFGTELILITGNYFGNQLMK